MAPPDPRRLSDDLQMDYREQRRPISGTEQELSVGVGKYSLSMKGANLAALVVSFACLAVIGWHANDQTRATTAMASAMTTDHSKMITSIERTMRLQTCVLSLTPEERIQWRQSRDAQQALLAYCPSLMVGLARHAPGGAPE